MLRKLTRQLLNVGNQSRVFVHTIGEVKVVEKEFFHIKDMQQEQFIQRVLGGSKIPSIVQQQCIQNVDEFPSSIFLKYYENGDLFDLLTSNNIEESLVKYFCVQILQCLSSIHDKCIVHGDIKPENIFIDEEFNIILGDFASSSAVDFRGIVSKRVGSLHYMAPEVYQYPETGISYDGFAADVWSVGSLVFALLFRSNPPHVGENSEESLDGPEQLLRDKKMDEFWEQFERALVEANPIDAGGTAALPSRVSADAKDFLEKTLCWNADERESIEALLGHRWLTSNTLSRSEYTARMSGMRFAPTPTPTSTPDILLHPSSETEISSASASASADTPIKKAAATGTGTGDGPPGTRAQRKRSFDGEISPSCASLLALSLCGSSSSSTTSHIPSTPLSSQCTVPSASASASAASPPPGAAVDGQDENPPRKSSKSALEVHGSQRFKSASETRLDLEWEHVCGLRGSACGITVAGEVLQLSSRLKWPANDASIGTGTGTDGSIGGSHTANESLSRNSRPRFVGAPFSSCSSPIGAPLSLSSSLGTEVLEMEAVGQKRKVVAASAEQP